MERSKVCQRATCPICFGPLKQVIESQQGVGGSQRRLEWIVCGGPCQKVFYPPWPEHQWSEPESRPIPAELAIVFDDIPPGQSQVPVRRAAA